MVDVAVTALVFAAVTVSEGVRRLPPGAFVLRRDAFGPWKLAAPIEVGTGLHLLAWFVPVSLPVVLADAGPDPALGRRRLVKRLDARARRADAEITVLRANGMLVLATLVLGVPLATSRWGSWGLLVGLALLAMLTAVQALVACVALHRTGRRWRSALAGTLRFLWPFSAPHAATAVQAQVLAGVPPLIAAHALLGEAALLRALRPLVYDVLHDVAAPDADALRDLCGADALRRFLAEPPSGAAGATWCPRCAALYQADIGECADCRVPLSAAAALISYS